MTTQAIQKDEDLIIFSDDSKTDNSILDFNFDVNEINCTTNQEHMINFGCESKTEKVSFDKEIVSDIDFGLVKNIESNDLEDLKLQSEQMLESSKELTDKFVDRNEILNETIQKLEQRKEIILQIKQTKQTNVDSLNEEIVKLKKQVSDLQTEIKDLEKEEGSIDLDISLIEKMKSNVLEISSERPRKHNLDNIKKVNNFSEV